MIYVLIITLNVIILLQLIKNIELQDELKIKKAENLALKRVMYENDLIPKEYVK